MRSRLNIKKAGRVPIRERIGPAKNLLKKRMRRRPARHEDTMLLAGLFRTIEQKVEEGELGWFTCFFAEITDEMGLDPFSAGCGAGIHRQFIPMPRGHCLCEDFPIFLFGGSPAAGSAEKSFSMKMFGELVRAKTNLFPWHFEGKNQKMRVRRGRLFEKEREAVAMVHCITMRSFPPEM